MEETRITKILLILAIAQVVVVLAFGLLVDVKFSDISTILKKLYKPNITDKDLTVLPGLENFTQVSYMNEYNIIVPAGSAWVYAYVDVTEGDIVDFSAEGKVYGDFVDKSSVAYGPWPPNGSSFYGNVFGPEALHSKYPLFSLIGRIYTEDDKTYEFLVGEKYRLVSPADGWLELAVNDCVSCYGDNFGSFYVTIKKESFN